MKSPTPLGKYLLKRIVGRGGMGVVYDAEDSQINRRVALKIMVLRPGTDPKEMEADRQRFVREAQLAAKLKHPNIVTLFEAGIIEGKRYLAMEFIEGESFADWWSKKSLKLSQKITALREVTMAVDHAHSKDILHRDLKPQKILVGADNAPYVMDFGLAKVIGTSVGLSLTGEGLTVGTPAYMSPEQARGLKTVDGRTDVYALGVMLYEILAGRKPFEGETAIEILMKASKDRVAPPSSSRVIARDPAVNQVIENICLKALARDPKNRYPTAKALADDLARWLTGDSVNININFFSTRRRILQPQKKSSGWIWGVVAAAVLGVILVPLLLPSSAPPIGRELLQARTLLREKQFTEARIAYERVLAKDPENLEARSGIRNAHLGEEKRKTEAESIANENREKLKRVLAAQADSERRAKEAEDKVRAATRAASDEEKNILLAELKAIKERARKAEEDARLARERLDRLDAERKAAPASTGKAPAPSPVPSPVPAAAPKPKPAPAARKTALAAELKLLREAARTSAAKFEFSAAFSLIDRAATEFDIDPLVEKESTLKWARKIVKTREEAGIVARGYLELTEEALALDKYKTAVQVSKEALRIAKQAGDALLAQDAVTLGKKIQNLRPVFDRFRKAQETLARTPDNEKANADAGRYLCLAKNRWEEGLPHLLKGNDRALRNIAQKELAGPADTAGQIALADGWFAVAQKERIRALKTACLARAVERYEAALPSTSAAERLRLTARINLCYVQGELRTTTTFVAKKSMAPFPAGYRTGSFPAQKSDDATDPFRGVGVYFNQKTGTDVVYEVRSGKRLQHLYWKGAAMSTMTIEILDVGGKVLAKGGPWGGGNVWGEFRLDFPPTSRFILRLRNNVSSWYYVDTLTLK